MTQTLTLTLIVATALGGLEWGQRQRRTVPAGTPEDRGGYVRVERTRVTLTREIPDDFEVCIEAGTEAACLPMRDWRDAIQTKE